MTEMNELADSPLAADEEGVIPYTSMPYADTQPSHLAALLALNDRSAPATSNARVLELGCASGGNIVPLAMRYPNAHFVGIDLSWQHIKSGRERASQLKLGNLDFRQGDVANISLEEPPFDYVICHGLYSWVPPEAQRAILRICREKLSPQGAAVISYNVLPGWRLRQAVRDICLQHADPAKPARARIAQVREILNEIAASSSETEPYGLLMRSEARRIAHRPGSYILGEFLAEHNSPCFFADFIAQTRAHGLEYVCETDLDASDRAAPDGATLARIAGGQGPLEMRAYADYFTGRTFRSSLLRRADGAGLVSPQGGPLRNLHLSADLRSAGVEGSHRRFQDSRGRTLAPDDRHVQSALARLADAYPNTLSWPELAGALPPEIQAQLESRLHRLAKAGQVRVSISPLTVAAATNPHPRLWELARLEIADGQPWITGQHHAAVALKPLVKVLAPLLDGLHDHVTLANEIATVFSRREVVVPELAGATEAPDAFALERLARTYLDRTLQHLARNGLLVSHDR